MKEFLKRSILGIFFGSFLALMVIFAVVYFGQNDVLQAEPLVKNSLGVIFCGWFYSVTPLFFENERLSLLTQTTLHFLCVTILYFFVAFVVGWVPFTMKGFLSMLGIFVLIYALIWFAFYMYFRRQAAKLNEELSDL